jgi:excinuclease UvrABC nuclease subunit
MTNIIKKSGILPWQALNITSAPSKPGVYVLRTATEISSIVYIGSSDNLERRLNEHFLTGDIPGVLFFDWYETNTLDEARQLERQWIIQYSPRYNERIG